MEELLTGDVFMGTFSLWKQEGAGEDAKATSGPQGQARRQICLSKERKGSLLFLGSFSSLTVLSVMGKQPCSCPRWSHFSRESIGMICQSSVVASWGCVRAVRFLFFWYFLAVSSVGVCGKPD